MAELTPERRKELDEFAYVMADPRGRAFIERLIVDQCRIFGSVMVQPHPAVPVQYAMPYNGGRQEIGQYILDEIGWVDSTGHLFTQTLLEAKNRHILQKEKEKGRTDAERDRDPRSNLDENRSPGE
jgi:hypothetical protein